MNGPRATFRLNPSPFLPRHQTPTKFLRAGVALASRFTRKVTEAATCAPPDAPYLAGRVLWCLCRVTGARDLSVFRKSADENDGRRVSFVPGVDWCLLEYLGREWRVQGGKEGSCFWSGLRCRCEGLSDRFVLFPFLFLRRCEVIVCVDVFVYVSVSLSRWGLSFSLFDLIFCIYLLFLLLSVFVFWNFTCTFC